MGINLNLVRRIVVRSAKIPIIFLVLGVLLNSLSFIDNIFSLPTWKNLFDWADKAGIILIVIAFFWFFYNVFALSTRKGEKTLRDKHPIASLILGSLRKSLRIIFILVALNVLILLLGTDSFYAILANNILNTLIIASLGWITIQILYTSEAIAHQHMLTMARKDLIRVKSLYTKLHVIRNIATVLIIVITIAVILLSFSSVRNIGISLLASAGFLTAIIGLAAQKPLASLFAGLQIALTQSIKLGDIVVIDNMSGIIEEINFTYVTLKLGDRRRLVVPVNYFIEKSFENWSREPDSLRSSMQIYVDYMLPIEPLREEFSRILSSSKYWDRKASKLEVANLNERSVELRIQVSAEDADALADLRAEVREKMLEFIRENYPHHFPKVRFDENNKK